MLYYLLFWILLGFIIHFYIIFGTNLLTQSPVPVPVFFPCFSVSKKRNIKQSPNGMKPSGEVIFGKKAIQETWSARQGINEEGTRQGGAPTLLVGPSWLPLSTSFAYIYPYTLKTSRSRIDREFRRRKPL